MSKQKKKTCTKNVKLFLSQTRAKELTGSTFLFILIHYYKNKLRVLGKLNTKRIYFTNLKINVKVYKCDHKNVYFIYNYKSRQSTQKYCLDLSQKAINDFQA